MNIKSLVYFNVQNQASYNNPFDLGSNFSQGLTVNHETSLQNYAYDLVSLYARFTGENYELSIDLLSESDRHELARLYIESIEREVGECVFGDDFSINNAYTCALLALLKNDSDENRRRFAEVTLHNILIYYRDTLQGVLDDACDAYCCTMLNEAGYRSRRDMEHGDMYWSKS